MTAAEFTFWLFVAAMVGFLVNDLIRDYLDGRTYGQQAIDDVLDERREESA